MPRARPRKLSMRQRRRLDFLLLDLLQVPNHCLPPMAHLVAGFAGAARRHADRARRDEIGQGARLRLFDVSECRFRGLRQPAGRSGTS